jgi:hypothetical protein
MQSNINEIKNHTPLLEKDSGLSSAEKRQALNAAFELAIQLDRFLLFPLYCYLRSSLPLPSFFFLSFFLFLVCKINSLCRPTIFKILAENGAQKDSVNLQKLYPKCFIVLAPATLLCFL